MAPASPRVTGKSFHFVRSWRAYIRTHAILFREQYWDFRVWGIVCELWFSSTFGVGWGSRLPFALLAAAGFPFSLVGFCPFPLPVSLLVSLRVSLLCDFTCEFTCEFACECTSEFTCEFACEFTCEFACEFTCEFACEFTCEFTCEFAS